MSGARTFRLVIAPRHDGVTRRGAPLLVLALLLAGCRGCPSGQPPIHIIRNMMNQPKVRPQAESAFFYDGAGMRVPVADTVSQTGFHDRDPVWTGKDQAGGFLTASPLPADGTVLARGEQRFGIYCQPCHGPQADGKGMLYQRAQVQSANLMGARFRAMPVGQLFDEVTHGVGLMPAYGPFVPAPDRWAILAYVRKLQSETPVPEETTAPGAAPGNAPPPSAGPGTSAAASATPPSPAPEGRR